MKDDSPISANKHDSRESWLRSATNILRPYYAECGYELPEKMRFAIAFPSTGRTGKRLGECWHFSTSADETTEIIIRADIAEPLAVLGILSHELLHAALPADAGHGKIYKDAALKIGLVGPMRHALPGPLLQSRLAEIAVDLGPLPHAALSIEQGRDNRGNPADRPKKQKARLLKASCPASECGYTVRITSKWVDTIGPPHCPVHGEMEVAPASSPAPDDAPHDDNNE